MEVAVFSRVVSLRRWYLSRDLKAGRGPVVLEVQQGGMAGQGQGDMEHGGSWRREDEEASGQSLELLCRLWCT